MAVNAENIMKRKELYTAPAILEEVLLDMDLCILAASHVKEPIEKDLHVEAMGQDLVDDIEWNHDWN